MLKKQENKYTMAKAVDKHLNDNEVVVSVTPELQAYKFDFSTHSHFSIHMKMNVQSF